MIAELSLICGFSVEPFSRQNATEGLRRVTESQASRHRFRLIVAAVIGVLLALHLVAHLQARYFQPDGVAYSYWALKLASGKFEFDSRAPLFQLMIAFSFRLFGAAQWSAAIFPQLLGILATLLIFAVARLMYDDKVGIVALILAVTNLTLMNLSAQILRETLLSFLVLLCVYVVLKFRGLRRVLLLGMLVGLLYWVREDLVAVILPLSIIPLLEDRAKLKAIFVMYGTAVLVGLPWGYYAWTNYGTLVPSAATFESAWGTVYAPSTQTVIAMANGVFYGINLLPSILSLFAFLFLIVGICCGIGRKQLLILGISATMLVVDSGVTFRIFSWPMPWGWSDASRYLLPTTMPLLVFSARGIVQTSNLPLIGRTVEATHPSLKFINRHRLEALLFLGLLLFGAGYVALLQTLSWDTEYPYYAAGQYMRSHGFRGAVMSFHPELLDKYYTGGEVLLLPNPPQYAAILELARARRVPYLLVDWSMTYFSQDVVSLYWSAMNSQSVPGFKYLGGEAAVWAVFEIEPT